MTDTPHQPDSSADGRPDRDDERMHVNLLLARDRNRRVLAEALSPFYDVSTGAEHLTDGDVDLCIVDADALNRHRAELEASKRASEPVFLPYLLVTRRDVNRLDADVWGAVDEVISAPIELRELRPRLESLLRLRRLSLELSERRQLEQMAAFLSHDLRNPLNVALGNLELARETGEADYFDTVEASLERMNDLIDDVLSLAREEYSQPDLGAVSIPAVARRTWERTEVDARLDLAFDDDTPILADESRLRELFANLFRNATEHNEAPVTVTVGDSTDGFYVVDDGTGIPASEREAIFETGYTTNERGTGFGLPIVERIADAHGWHVSVSESESGGAHFEVTGVRSVDESSATDDE